MTKLKVSERGLGIYANQLNTGCSKDFNAVCKMKLWTVTVEIKWSISIREHHEIKESNRLGPFHSPLGNRLPLKNTCSRKTHGIHSKDSDEHFLAPSAC